MKKVSLLLSLRQSARLCRLLPQGRKKVRRNLNPMSGVGNPLRQEGRGVVKKISEAFLARRSALPLIRACES